MADHDHEMRDGLLLAAAIAIVVFLLFLKFVGLLGV